MGTWQMTGAREDDRRAGRRKSVSLREDRMSKRRSEGTEGGREGRREWMTGLTKKEQEESRR